MSRYVIAFAVFLIALGIVYIRLAPVDLTDIHVRAEAQVPGDYTARDGFTAIRAMTASPLDVAGAVNRVILKTPRTERVAGDLGTSMMTYRTRSAVFGFPDFATVSFIDPGEVGNDGALLVIRSRLTYGVSDLAVNEARVKAWLEELGPLTVTP